MGEKNIQLFGYDFSGPYPINSTHFNNVAGVFVITRNDGSIIEVNETEKLNKMIPNPVKAWRWRVKGGQDLWFHHESNAPMRLEKEKALKRKMPRSTNLNGCQLLCVNTSMF